VVKLLPPESRPIEAVAAEIGVTPLTLERWRDQALAEPARERDWTPAARLEAVIATSGLDEVACNAWCRENGVFPQQLRLWRESAMQALADPEPGHGQKQVRQERLRIQQLERELSRKEKALAETAALLVLSKKVEAIFKKGGGE
jgi:transposase